MANQPSIMKQIGMKILYVVLMCILVPISWVGKLLFCISKLLRALSHLMMFNFSTAKKEITDWRVMVEIRDAL